MVVVMMVTVVMMLAVMMAVMLVMTGAASALDAPRSGIETARAKASPRAERRDFFMTLFPFVRAAIWRSPDHIDDSSAAIGTIVLDFFDNFSRL
ncbi:hypothetical protein AJ88_06535 [Mesorhizobium amorphae CCBAU 01583]|nr:hypothetical protein AJ88_06535 [Mesorhizobium amorphae CCBAU 01583]